MIIIIIIVVVVTQLIRLGVHGDAVLLDCKEKLNIHDLCDPCE